MGIEPRPKLGKLRLKRENARICGICAFFILLKWIPIGAAVQKLHYETLRTLLYFNSPRDARALHA